MPVVVNMAVCDYPLCGRVRGGCHAGCPGREWGWRDDGLKEAAAIICAIPELNAVLERESALLAQNVVSAIVGSLHENSAAALTNTETKKALARSMLVGLQYGMANAKGAS